MKNKKIIKYIKSVIIILFVTFSVIYFTGVTGYIEFQNKKTKELTEKQIEKFEKDIENGKKIDLEEYISNTKANYHNKISKTGMNLSKKTGDVATKILKVTFEKISKLIDE